MAGIAMPEVLPRIACACAEGWLAPIGGALQRARHWHIVPFKPEADCTILIRVSGNTGVRGMILPDQPSGAERKFQCTRIAPAEAIWSHRAHRIIGALVRRLLRTVRATRVVCCG